MSAFGAFLLCILFWINCQALSNVDVTWYAPFFSAGGYCSEATSFMFAMESVNFTSFSISQHGDSYHHVYLEGLTGFLKQKLQHYDTINKHARRNQFVKDNEQNTVLSIDICHSEPGAWHAPQPRYHTVRCPSDRRYKYEVGTTVIPFNIGRTMFETDRIPNGWADRLNYMDEIWVPTEFSRNIFEQAGVTKDKLIVVGEAVDTDFFRPMDVTELSEQLRSDLGLPSQTALSPYQTIFLFVGKFETRKGLKSLFQAYYKSFTSADKVLLLILTSSYHSSEDLEADISTLLHSAQLSEHPMSSPPRHMVLTGVKHEGMPYLYSLSTALVIPSHGEGWGRPHMEAMSCGTPVVATNWSGPTAFMHQQLHQEQVHEEVEQVQEYVHSNADSIISSRNSGANADSVDGSISDRVRNSSSSTSTGYLVGILPELVPAEGWKGHYWAQPNISHLSDILRTIHTQNSEPTAVAAGGVPAADPERLIAITGDHPNQVGLRARQDIIKRFSLPVMGAKLVLEYERIRKKLLGDSATNVVNDEL